MKVNLVMPDDLVAQIDVHAKRLGVSRSAYMVMSMSEKIQSEEVMRSMPDLQGLMNQMQRKLSSIDPQVKREEEKVKE